MVLDLDFSFHLSPSHNETLGETFFYLAKLLCFKPQYTISWAIFNLAVIHKVPTICQDHRMRVAATMSLVEPSWAVSLNLTRITKELKKEAISMRE